MTSVLITSATGQQGKATITALFAAGATKIHAVVRDPAKPAARSLDAQGVVLFKGENNDFETFREAANGCKALFLNLVAWPDNPDPGRQTEEILSACREAGVEHVVVSTSGWAGDRKKWDIPENAGYLSGFNENEALVEQAVRNSGLSYTILRPFWFHSNYLPPVANHFYPQLSETGELVHSFAAGAKMPHINVVDIGRFAAMALLNPAKFNRREVELATQNLSIEEVAATLRKITGSEIKTRARMPDEMDQPAVQWQRWASVVDMSLDTKALELVTGFLTGFTSLEEYIMEEKAQFTSSIGG